MHGRPRPSASRSAVVLSLIWLTSTNNATNAIGTKLNAKTRPNRMCRRVVLIAKRCVYRGTSESYSIPHRRRPSQLASQELPQDTEVHPRGVQDSPRRIRWNRREQSCHYAVGNECYPWNLPISGFASKTTVCGTFSQQLLTRVINPSNSTATHVINK